jgi:hypothetical protein
VYVLEKANFPIREKNMDVRRVESRCQQAARPAQQADSAQGKLATPKRAKKEVTTATSSSMITITKVALVAIAVSLCLNLSPVDAVDAPISFPVKNLGSTGWDFIVNNKLVTGTLALLAYAIFACGKTYLQKPGAGLIAAAAADAAPAAIAAAAAAAPAAIAAAAAAAADAAPAAIAAAAAAAPAAIAAAADAAPAAIAAAAAAAADAARTPPLTSEERLSRIRELRKFYIERQRMVDKQVRIRRALCDIHQFLESMSTKTT